MARPGGVLLPPGVGFPSLSLVVLGEKEGGEREEVKGSTAPLPSPIRTIGGGGVRPALAASLSTKAH